MRDTQNKREREKRKERRKKKRLFPYAAGGVLLDLEADEHLVGRLPGVLACLVQGLHGQIVVGDGGPVAARLVLLHRRPHQLQPQTQRIRHAPDPDCCWLHLKNSSIVDLVPKSNSCRLQMLGHLSKCNKFLIHCLLYCD